MLFAGCLLEQSGIFKKEKYLRWQIGDQSKLWDLFYPFFYSNQIYIIFPYTVVIIRKI